MISIIIPTYNEEDILIQKMSYFKNLARNAELIFIDGGSSDKSPEIAKKYGQLFFSQKGRASQMNYGASHARGKILLFLHADTSISLPALEIISEQVNKQLLAGGCFSQQIDKKGIVYRLIEGFGNIRARSTKIYYGDQGIFVKKDIFLKAGGFPQVPIMEDVLFTKMLRRTGKTIVLRNKILVSGRRWEKRGIIKTVLLYSFINILFRLGIPLIKVKAFYDDLR